MAEGFERRRTGVEEDVAGASFTEGVAEVAGKKGKKSKRAKVKSAKSPLPGIIMAAFVVGVIVYGVLLYVEQTTLAGYEKKPVFVANTDIAKGTRVDAGNAESYFTLKNVDASLVPDTAISSLDQVSSMYTAYNMDAGTYLTTSMFIPEDEVKSGIENPVLAGFSTDDIYQTVTGTLRTGDIINIYEKVEAQVLSETGDLLSIEEVKLLWENVFIEEAFANDGTSIANEDDVALAQRFNIFLAKDEVEEFYAQLESGKLIISKVPDGEVGTQAKVRTYEEAQNEIMTAYYAGIGYLYDAQTGEIRDRDNNIVHAGNKSGLLDDPALNSSVYDGFEDQLEGGFGESVDQATETESAIN